MTVNKKFKPYEKRVLENKAFFERMIKRINNTNDIELKSKIAKKAIDYALSNSTSYYSSSVIENVFLDIAQNNTIENLPEEFKPNSFLHVMTESYAFGGHTRVVERWIESADNGEKHSLVFTGYNESLFIPDRLKNAVDEKGGSVTFIENKKSDIEKGLELRKIASGYQTIILHLHMHDIIPIIAFGNTQFKRPVLLYNLADQYFWVGASIADFVADLKETGQELTLKRRGVKNNFSLSVPVDIKNTKIISKQEARRKLNLPEDKKIILTIGTAYKYKPILDLSFIKMIEPLLQADKNVLCIGVGPCRYSLPEWKNAEEQYKGQVLPIGTIPHTDLYDYIFASDVVVDGIPIGGGTSLIDAISCNRPVLLIDNPMRQLDYILKSAALCKDLNELATNAYKLLYDEKMQKDNIQDVLEKLNECNTIPKWKDNLKKLISILPKEHSIHKLEQTGEHDILDRDIFCYLCFSSEKQVVPIFKIPFILTLYKLKDLYSSKSILKIFNIEFKFRERIMS